MRWLLAPVVLFAVLAVAIPAAAAPADAAVEALKSGSIYVQPNAQNGYGKRVEVDQETVSEALGDTVKVAIFDTGTNGSDAVRILTASVQSGRVMLVFVGSRYEVRTRSCSSAVDTVRDQINAHAAEMRDGQYTDALVAVGKNVSCGSESGTGTAASHGDTGKKTNAALVTAVVIGGVGLLGAAGVGGFLWSRRRRKQRELADARAAVMPYYDRLAHEVNTLNAGDDAVARQALADASERYTSAGSQMATADSIAQWASVRRTVLEGLEAAQAARRSLGVEPGPTLPPIEEPRGEQLTGERTVDVQGKQYRGYPEYTPGAPYYFAGGGGYPGGWYTFPFWETLLIGSVLGGGWGFGGGGYGAGYDSGYASGY
ncbi:MAG TPA: hypothetical protein VHI14_09505, partial [Jatrophihabitantaceae bacterium]|nr:hypothetical protein [Jatrophihabitantaceae bacterium]